MVDFTRLEKACQDFSKEEMPFLSHSIEKMSREKPLLGKKIVHNCHMTLSTICKIAPLLVSGADITITMTPGLKCHDGIVELMRDFKINFVEPTNLKDDYDFSLDCCAGLLDIIHPRLGAVELTQTGSVQYKKAKGNYPVISVDESRVKRLETLLGTGDGFLRALLYFTQQDITNKKFILFGYGKVGHGIYKAISPYTKQIVIIEKNPNLIHQIIHEHKIVLSIENLNEIKNQIKHAFCVVTATGEQGMLSNYFTRDDFETCEFLANMGSEDEYGDNFTDEDALYGKAPINFALAQPTLLKFLDPVFYAHNYGIEILLKTKFTKRFNYLPKKISREIVSLWGKYHQFDVSEILKS